MLKTVVWTPDDIDNLIYLYENHTHPFLLNKMKEHGKSKNAVSNKIKELKELGFIAKSERLSLEDRLENDKEANGANELNLDRIAFRKRQRKFYQTKALELLGL